MIEKLEKELEAMHEGYAADIASYSAIIAEQSSRYLRLLDELKRKEAEVGELKRLLSLGLSK